MPHVSNGLRKLLFVPFVVALIDDVRVFFFKPNVLGFGLLEHSEDPLRIEFVLLGAIDIYPTLLELCGLPANSALPGRSLVPLMKNPKREWQSAGITSYGPDHITARTEGWRYSRQLVPRT